MSGYNFGMDRFIQALFGLQRIQTKEKKRGHIVLELYKIAFKSHFPYNSMVLLYSFDKREKKYKSQSGT